nr:ATP-binding protein [Chloroflexota bacterium]
EQNLAQNAHVTRLVGALSLLARADSGAVPLERRSVDLARVATEAADSVAFLAEYRRVGLRVEARAGSWVRGDAGRLRQLLLILLDNALTHTPDGGTIAIRVGGQGGRVYLRVQDTGPGIAAADLPHLFDRFYRADRARGGEGAGLGLAIGRWIAEAHGGRIVAANAPEGGALFSVTLPRLP